MIRRVAVFSTSAVAPTPDHVSRKIPQTGKAIAGIDVVLNHVEGEIVKAAEAPNGNDEQEGDGEAWCVDEEQCRRKHAHEEEENALQLDEPRVGEIGHEKSIVSERHGIQPYCHTPSLRCAKSPRERFGLVQKGDFGCAHPMKCAVIVIGILMLAGCCSLARDSDVQKGKSPTGEITYVTSGDESTNMIWLAPTSRPHDWVELCAADQKYVQLTFSPNEKWLAVTVNHVVLSRSLRLFKRTEGFRFVEVQGPDISQSVEKLIMKQLLPEKLTSISATVGATLWSADSAAMLLCIEGGGSFQSSDFSLKPWFCIYEVETGQILFDMSKYHFNLSAMNRRAVRKVR